ncbi:MAG TPA: UrcA family protein [Rhizomicrobium sp.]|nr:UrcA family protein [Rhizomicrobium sp.]
MFKKTIRLLGAVGMLSGLNTAAMAQSAAPAVEQIIVTAPLIVEVKKPANATAAQSAGAGKGVFTVLTASSNVSFADLDITKYAGINTLEKRISDTATATCNQLKRKYPESVYVPVQTADCVKSATDQAMNQVFAIMVASAK